MTKTQIIYILTFFSFPFSKSYCQVGVGTQNLMGVFHIDGNKDNNITGSPTILQQSNDFVITSGGMIGVGTITPSAKLDLRDANIGNSALGIGNSSFTADVVGAGAIKYDPLVANIAYSNGSEWIPVKALPNPMVRVVAENNSSLAFTNSSSTELKNWSEILDTTNSFDPVTGIFTALRNGVYTVSASFNFNSGNISSNSFTRLEFKSSVGETNYCIAPYAAAGIAEAGDACSTAFYLLAGQTLKLSIYNSLGEVKTFKANSGYSNITILEN